MENTALYAALLSFLLVALSFRVIKVRRKFQVSMGDAGNDYLQPLIRAHANFIEYTPISLILIASAEINSFVPVWCIHIIGLLLLSGRIMHAYGLSNNLMSYQVKGMQLTLGVIMVTGVINVIGAVSHWF